MKILECPRCHSSSRPTFLSGHSYPVVEGVPVFVLPEKEQTIDVALASYDAAANATGASLYLKTIGVSDIERAGIEADWAQKARVDRIDPAISYLIGATCGLGYVNLIGRLKSYPIPKIPVKPGAGKLLLDLGATGDGGQFRPRARVGTSSVLTHHWARSWLPAERFEGSAG